MSNRYDELRRELNADSFLQQARETAGLKDFGDETFIAGLRKLVDCVASDVNFTDNGLREFKGDVVRNLVNRLRFQEDLKRHPEILEEDVSDPIIILGLPRSGTTKTQRMFAADDRLQHLYMWQFMNVAPFPDAVPGQPDPRMAAALRERFVSDNATGVQAAHFWTNEQPEEDFGLMAISFNAWYWNVRAPSRSWHEWVLSRKEPSDLHNMRYFKSLFQYLQWQAGGRKAGRRVMKNITNHNYMDELMTAYPNATLIHIHRTPFQCLPSMGKVLHQVATSRVIDQDLKDSAKMTFEMLKPINTRYLEARDRLKLDGRILDIPYEKIRSDSISAFKEIYRHANMEMTPVVEQRLREWETNNEQGKHGEHKYSLEEVGYSEDMINEAFGAYMKRFQKYLVRK